MMAFLSIFFLFCRAESGPAGAQFGILASQIVEVLNVWPALKSPGVALGKDEDLLAYITVTFYYVWPALKSLGVALGKDDDLLAYITVTFYYVWPALKSPGVALVTF